MAISNPEHEQKKQPTRPAPARRREGESWPIGIDLCPQRPVPARQRATEHATADGFDPYLQTR